MAKLNLKSAMIRTKFEIGFGSVEEALEEASEEDNKLLDNLIFELNELLRKYS